MQINLVYIFLSALTCISLSANGAESTRENFLRVTGLRLGEVELINGPAECRFSTLGLIEIGDDSVSLMTGAIPLITGLGSKPDQYKERGCDMTEVTEYKGRTAKWRKTQDCSGKIFEYSVNLLVLENGFAYRRLNTQDGKVVLDLPCRYKYVSGRN